MNIRTRNFALFVTTLSASVIPPSHVSAQPVVRTVALLGDPAPDIFPAESFEFFGVPAINAEGGVAFSSSLSGNFGLSTAVFAERARQPLELVFSSFMEIPGTTTGQRLAGAGLGNFNASSQVSVLLQIVGGEVDGTSNFGVFSEGGGNGLQTIVRTRDPAPGTDAIFTLNPQFASLSANDGGALAIVSNLNDAVSDAPAGNGLFVASPDGSLSLLSRNGDSVPEVGLNIERHGRPQISNVGTTLVQVSLGDDAVLSFFNSAILTFNSDGDRRLIAHREMTAPGTEAGTTFRGFAQPLIGDGGRVTFSASVAGPDVTDLNRTGLWTAVGEESLRLVARAGMVAPGLDPDATFDGFLGSDANDRNTLAFTATLSEGAATSSQARGLFLEDAEGGLQRLLSSGQLAPSVADAERQFVAFGLPEINNRDQIAFEAPLADANTGVAVGSGLFVVDADGQLAVVAEEGQAFDINDDPLVNDFRTVADIELRRGGKLNDAGQLAFFLRFEDGTRGVFVATVPEPSALLFCGGSLSLMLHRRRQRKRVY